MIWAVLAGVIGAWLGIAVWGGVNGDLGIVNIHAAIYPATSGRTQLSFPPFGSMSARTHLSPVRMELSINQVHIEETAQWLKKHKSPQQTANLIGAGIKRIAIRLACISLVIAAIGAFFACGLCNFKGRQVVVGTISGLIGVVLPLVLAACTYNTGAFDTPDFQGEMSRAPGLFNIAQRAWKKNSGVMQDVLRISARTSALYQQVGNAGYDQIAAQAQYTRVLLVSDLHNNPMGVRFALNLAGSYKPKLVLITGDFTDLGHPLEAHLLVGLKKFGVPIVGVAGNHDSRSTIKALKTIPKMTMLDNGDVVEKCKLSIMGYADPASKRAETGSIDVSSRQIRRLTSRIRSRLDRSNPDILMVHNNDVGDNIGGYVPVVVDGHLHIAYVKRRRGGIIVNPGTTGAAGIRYFSVRKKPAYTAAVLQFSTGDRPRLQSVDSISMELPSGDFTVSRKSVL